MLRIFFFHTYVENYKSCQIQFIIHLLTKLYFQSWCLKSFIFLSHKPRTQIFMNAFWAHCTHAGMNDFGKGHSFIYFANVRNQLLVLKTNMIIYVQGSIKWKPILLHTCKCWCPAFLVFLVTFYGLFIYRSNENCTVHIMQ